MIRIVGIERNQDPDREFILLQNQGVMRQTLRGHAVVPEQTLDTDGTSLLWHLFSDAEAIYPGAYVMLRTGDGVPRWTRTRDGSNVYNTFMGRDSSVWSQVGCPVHVLAMQHSFVDRTTSAATIR